MSIDAAKDPVAARWRRSLIDQPQWLSSQRGVMLPNEGMAKLNAGHGTQKGIEYEDVRVCFSGSDALESFDGEVRGPAAVRSADA